MASMDVPMGEFYKDLKGLVKEITWRLKCAKHLKRNYKELTKEEEYLFDVRHEIEAEANRHKQKKLTVRWVIWIEKVENIKKDVQELKANFEKEVIRNKITRWFSHSILSGKIEKKCGELKMLRLEGEGFKGKLVVSPPERVIPIDAEETADKPSLHKVIEEILGYLKKTDISRIGLWGGAGIGKTNILKNLNNNKDVAGMFDIIIWVEVSRNWSEKGVKDAIVRRLKLDIEDKDHTNDIADYMNAELEKKKCLLLLDDVCQSFDLSGIGIPANAKYIKVILTTRYDHVCYQMKVEKKIKLEGLSEPDAYKMFKEKAGPNVDLPDIEPIAIAVVQECAPSPLLINIAAKAFGMKQSYDSWKDGLRRLKQWYCINLNGEDDLSDFTEFFYENLKNEKKKCCFLYTGLYPEGTEIYKDYLLECWNAEGFIDASKLIEARGSGEVILEELINVSFLEKCTKLNHVKMNRVLRKMAFRVCSKSDNFKVLIKTGVGQQPPGNVELEELRRMSLIDHEPSMEEISKCKNLLTLLVRGNKQLVSLCESFFTSLMKLRVLDLYGAGIASLPLSITYLRDLKALYLNACSKLTELPFNEQNSINLEVLDIQNTGINYLATRIRFLTGLKALRISLSWFGRRKSKKKESRPKVLSELHQLEELRIVVTEDVSWKKGVRAIIGELVTLKHLNSLSISFPTVDCLQLFISKSEPWKTPDFKFQFSVGHHDSIRYQILDLFKYPIRKSLKFVDGADTSKAISEVLAKTNVFELIEHKTNIKLSDFGIESIMKLRACLIKGCGEIETIVESDSTQINVLSDLEKLHIDDVPKLTSIWKGGFGAGSLAQLETLILCKCRRLKKIFSNGMIAALCKLQKLEVQKCPEVEEIIMKSENRDLQPNALPSLKIVVLLDLQNVRSIGFDDLMTWPSLRRVRISRCPCLKGLPFKNDIPINLEFVEVENSWWNALPRTEDAVAVKGRLQTKIKFI